MSTNQYDNGEPGVRARCLAYLETLEPGPTTDALGTLDALMRDNKLSQADVLRYLGARNPPPGWALRNVGTNDDLETDDLPMASEADDGCWVSGWIWADRPTGDDLEKAVTVYYSDGDGTPSRAGWYWAWKDAAPAEEPAGPFETEDEARLDAGLDEEENADVV